MTTSAPTATNFASATNTEFRAWVQEFDALLLAIGLVNTADTGQLDPATVNVPSLNAVAGYRMYRTNDGLTDIYLRFEFGLGAQNTRPTVNLRIGYTTNGSGTLTGTFTSNLTIAVNTSITSTSTPYQSRACGVTGAWWLGFKEGAGGSSSGYMGWALFRHCDADGAPNDNGFVIYTLTITGSVFSTNLVSATSTISSRSGAACLIPFGYTDPVVGAGLQFWKHYSAQPRMRVNPYALTTRIDATPSGTTRSMSPVAGMTKTYISAGYVLGGVAGEGAATNNTMMLVWE